MKENLQILLATYNGEKYIDELLGSLLKQSYTDWRILAHDDGSSDNTLKKLKDFEILYPNKITIIDDGIKLGGAMKNFRHLLIHCTANYIAFCDQDDIWLPEKLQLSMDLISKNEQQFGTNTPLCVFTDLSITDEALNITHSSMMHANGVVIEDFTNINNLAYSNCIPGCSMLINKKAIQVSTPMPNESIMHDWWVALSVLYQGGNISMVDKPMILYRQHGSNTLGFKKNNVLTAIFKVFSFSKYINEFQQVYISNKNFVNGNKIIFFLKYAFHVGVYLRFRRLFNRLKTASS